MRRAGASNAVMTGQRVLYLSYDGMTDPLVQSQVLPYLAGLSKRGHRIAIRRKIPSTRSLT